MSEEAKVKVGIKQEGVMIFKADLGKIKMQDLFIDERPKRAAEKIGPTPSRLLGLAVLGCLVASFTFCFQKKKFSLKEIGGEAEVIMKRNEKGFWRIMKINVSIKPMINDPLIRKRADQCIKMFEQYCTITQSVREGIEVNVDIDY